MQSVSIKAAPKAIPAAIILLLTACARPAPSLPPVNAAALIQPTVLDEPGRINRCTELAATIGKARQEILEIEQVMQGRRNRDQLSAYLVAVLYPPMLTTIDQQKSRKRALDQRQAEIDRHLTERQARSCP